MKIDLILMKAPFAKLNLYARLNLAKMTHKSGKRCHFGGYLKLLLGD